MSIMASARRPAADRLEGLAALHATSRPALAGEILDRAVTAIDAYAAGRDALPQLVELLAELSGGRAEIRPLSWRARLARWLGVGIETRVVVIASPRAPTGLELEIEAAKGRQAALRQRCFDHLQIAEDAAADAGHRGLAALLRAISRLILAEAWKVLGYLAGQAGRVADKL